MAQVVTRRDDYPEKSRLRVIVDDDGDVSVAIIDGDGRMLGVEFVTPMRGGGKSPNTWHALRRLAKAMARDDEDSTSLRLGDSNG